RRLRALAGSRPPPVAVHRSQSQAHHVALRLTCTGVTMASVGRVPTGWRARWRTPEGLSRSKTFDRKADAERFLTTIEGAKLVGGYVDPSAGRVRFEDFALQWLASQTSDPS